MTFRQATMEMLEKIRVKELHLNNYRIKDKEIAEHIGITPVTYSRLHSGTQEPNIQTFFKIYYIYEAVVGMKEAYKLFEEILGTYKNKNITL